jgi:hypothetical protein
MKTIILATLTSAFQKDFYSLEVWNGLDGIIIIGHIPDTLLLSRVATGRLVSYLFHDAWISNRETEPS